MWTLTLPPELFPPLPATLGLFTIGKWTLSVFISLDTDGSIISIHRFHPSVCYNTDLFVLVSSLDTGIHSSLIKIDFLGPIQSITISLSQLKYYQIIVTITILQIFTQSYMLINVGWDQLPGEIEAANYHTDKLSWKELVRSLEVLENLEKYLNSRIINTKFWNFIIYSNCHILKTEAVS